MTSDAFYSGMADLALSLLTRFGKPITIVRETGNDIDRATGHIFKGQRLIFESNGVIKNPEDRQVDGTSVLKSDKFVVLDASNEILSGDRVLINNEEWPIISVQEKKPSNVVVAYELQVRR